MYTSEIEMRIRYEELRREADRRRLVREATAGARTRRHAEARSGADEPGGRVRSRWTRARRATA
ncbi:hypothetical protein [Streptomyces sp. NPDC101393]|uniref:hypothetical protein n=1 Tax=Streptomyces sp. NPDC101393 TaxID=3366141 RepID=UPI003805BAEA